MKISEVTCHPQHPHKIWVIVEQPRNEPRRIKFDASTEIFYPTEKKSLGYERGFLGVYGWVGGCGTPPSPHLDVMLLTEKDLQPGEVIIGTVCGIFLRQDGDHKVVAADETVANQLAKPELSCLPPDTYANLIDQYPRVGENEGWFGTEIAYQYIDEAVK